jgi:phosphonopyruvate decarboxylase
VIDTKPFFQLIKDAEINFIAGVPDSLTATLISELELYAKENRNLHLLSAANEGLAVSMSIGSFLANGRPGIVYMQNSGLGNAINPLLSLVHYSVFNVPLIMLIGWRGEPSFSDEPQHNVQGNLTLSFLESIEAKYIIVRSNDDFQSGIGTLTNLMHEGNLGIFTFLFSREAFI